jgi:carboxylesterase type B
MQGAVCGKVIETSSGKSVKAYLGIPYAESTAEQNRWRPPVPITSWKGVLKATELGPYCPQNSNSDHSQSEDCLSVNVWTPLNSGDKPRAVMVFIHGGGFVIGSSADPTYDGAYTAARGDVVVVTINYRLGALGFLSGIKDKATGEEINGNFGLLDQILALKWVRDNISAFGGDPARVTIYGESAGAMSVGIHMVSSPGSQGLFRAGIMESNPLGLPYKTLKEGASIAHRFAGNLGCAKDDVSCMRDKLAWVVLDAQVQKDLLWPAVFHGLRDLLVWSPVIDGTVVTGQPVAAIAEGKLNTPVIIGTNENEGLLFIEIAKAGLRKETLSGLDYRLMIDFMFRNHKVRTKIYEKYPPYKEDNTKLISRLVSDYFFTCPSLYAARYTGLETWSYQFDQVSSFNIWPHTPACAEAVCHGDELVYVFHSAENRGYSFTPAENELSELMVDYWTNFAKHLDPNGAAVNWPPYGKDALSLIFVTPVEDIKTKSGLVANCQLWDEIGYDLHTSFWGTF